MTSTIADWLRQKMLPDGLQKATENSGVTATILTVIAYQLMDNLIRGMVIFFAAIAFLYLGLILLKSISILLGFS